VADSNGKILANFGDVARADKPKFEDTAINKQYGWRGWFNGERDRKDLSAQQRRDFPEPLAQEALIKRPSDLYCSAPYRRPVDGIWVIAISCRLTARDGQAPVGVLFGQFALEKFVDFIRHFESSAGYQRRKVVVANEMGQAMYHPRLKNPVDPTAAAMDEEGGAEDVPEVSPKSKDYEYFLKTAFSSDDDSAETRARTDPWDAKPGETYFVGSEVISLDMGRIRRGEEGQKLAVFVFHQKDRALQGFMRAKWTILLLGFGVLLVASVLFVAVLLGLRLATRLESLTSSS